MIQWPRSSARICRASLFPVRRRLVSAASRRRCGRPRDGESAPSPPAREPTHRAAAAAPRSPEARDPPPSLRSRAARRTNPPTRSVPGGGTSNAAKEEARGRPFPSDGRGPGARRRAGAAGLPPRPRLADDHRGQLLHHAAGRRPRRGRCSTARLRLGVAAADHFRPRVPMPGSGAAPSFIAPPAVWRRQSVLLPILRRAFGLLTRHAS